MKSQLLNYIIPNIVSRGIFGFSGIFIAKSLSPQIYGEFATSLNVAMALITLLTGGFVEYLLIVRNENLWHERYQTSVVWAVLLYSFFIIFGYLLNFRIFVFISMWLLFYKLLSNFFVAYFQVMESYGRLGLMLLLQGGVFFLFLVLFSASFLNLGHFLFGLTISSILITIMFFRYQIQSFNIKKLKLDVRTLKESGRYSFSSLLSYIYMSSDVVMLAWLDSSKAAGIYAAGTIFVFAVMSFYDIIYKYFLSKYIVGDKFEVLSLFSFSMLLLGLFGSVNVFVNSEILLTYLGDDYSQSIQILRSLSIVIFIHSICYIFIILLSGEGLVHLRNRSQFYAALFNLLANLILIPFWGVYGAVVSTIISEFILLTLYFLQSRKLLKVYNAFSLKWGIGGIFLFSQGLIFFFVTSYDFRFLSSLIISILFLVFNKNKLILCSRI